MLPDIITLNVGSPAADVIYNISHRAGNRSFYYAESANNDLEGRPTLQVSQEETNSGLQRTLVQLRDPEYVDGEYVGHVQCNVTTTRRKVADLDLVDLVLEKAEKLSSSVTDFRQDIGAGES